MLGRFVKIERSGMRMEEADGILSAVEKWKVYSRTDVDILVGRKPERLQGLVTYRRK